MLASTPALDRPLQVVSDLAQIHDVLRQIREAYAEVSLGDLVSDDETQLRQERWRCRRSELQIPVVVTPVEFASDDEGVIVCGPEQIGVTRDVGASGMGLTHDHLLAGDAALVQIDLPHVGPQYLVLDLRWSVRETRYSYVSGGRIVGLVDSLP